MLERHIELKIVEWDDIPFREAIEDALEAVRRSGPPEMDAARAAADLQALVRAAGYRSATVIAHQTVDDALAHVSHLEVRRDPVALLTSR